MEEQKRPALGIAIGVVSLLLKAPLTFREQVSKLFVQYVETALKQIADKDSKNGPGFYVTVVCPGATQSELGREAKQFWYLRIALWLFQTLLQRTTEQGARTYISGVTLGEKGHGKFWKDDTIRE